MPRCTASRAEGGASAGSRAFATAAAGGAGLDSELLLFERLSGLVLRNSSREQSAMSVSGLTAFPCRRQRRGC